MLLYIYIYIYVCVCVCMYILYHESKSCTISAACGTKSPSRRVTAGSSYVLLGNDVDSEKLATSMVSSAWNRRSILLPLGRVRRMRAVSAVPAGGSSPTRLNALASPSSFSSWARRSASSRSLCAASSFSTLSAISLSCYYQVNLLTLIAISSRYLPCRCRCHPPAAADINASQAESRWGPSSSS